MENALILIVEDEPEIARILQSYLERDGFRTVCAGDGEIALTHLKTLRPDLVLLDIGLPRRDGFSVLTEIRGRENTPVIMTTARAEDLDKLSALRIGADDYVVKPFNPMEVVARVKAVLRRTRGEDFGHPVLRVDTLEVDTENYRASVARGGDRLVLDLTLTEYRLLAHLARAPRRVFTRGPGRRMPSRKQRSGAHRRQPCQQSPPQARSGRCGWIVRGGAGRGIQADGIMTEPPIRRRRWRRWPLSRQIAIVLAGAVLMNAVLFVVTMTIFVSIEEQRIERTLSPAATRALRASEASRLPRTEDLAAYLRETRGMEDLVDERINTALALFTLLAATAGFALGYVLLGRLGRGLNNVAHAARRVAEGDLSAQASAPKWASREEYQLASDFNAMSRSLQRAERELAESTAAVAHELRTPLTILRGRLHGIEDGVFPGGPEEMRGLLFQVEGLGRLIDDLQTLNLAKSNRMLLDLVAVDLSEQVEHVLAVVRPDLEAAGLDPVLDLVPAVVVADGGRLRQAISAVLNNAQRYAAQSGVLRIHTRIEEDDGVLEIVDHGPGLPPGTSELAFDRFWRAEGSRARHSGGTGLGLAIVRVIVEAHGGSATLESHDGGGTVFTMRLPRAGRST